MTNTKGWPRGEKLIYYGVEQGGCLLIALGLTVLLWGTVAYVAFHFLAKLW